VEAEVQTDVDGGEEVHDVEVHDADRDAGHHEVHRGASRFPR
jgi:hypothetical protein